MFRCFPFSEPASRLRRPGTHFRLGASLTQREISVMSEELLRRVPTIEVAGEVEYLRSNFVNGIKRLPARID